MAAHPILIFGGASIGSSYTTPEAVTELLSTLQSLSISRIDTAARYPPTSPGSSERLLGQAGAASQGFTIDTKILASGDGSGNLEPAAIEKSLQQSYERLALQNTKVNVLYCHRPDSQTPLEEQAAALNAQYKKGLFTQLGVSNFSPALLTQFIEICDRKGFVKPTVYQGQYNLICRASEEILLPMLRKHNIIFTAFSPLAGGFLTGRLTANETEGTRFAEGNIMGQALRAQYDKKEMHDAISTLNSIIGSLSISKVEACLRWICFHSALSPQDGIILGASKTTQLAANLKAIAKGPLPEHVVAAMDAIWRSVSNKVE